MSAEEMRAALAEIGDRWEIQQEPISEDVERVFTGLPVPPTDELRVLYEYSEGGYVGTVQVFVLVELEMANADPDNRRDFPSAIFFASDGGDGWFFVDTEDDMGQGAGAIFWVDRASMTWGSCIPCALSLPAFLLAAARDEKPWQEHENLAEQSTRAMLAALDAHPEVWIGNPPATLSDVLAATRQVGAAIPYPLEKIVRKTNGLLFTTNGVAIANVQQFIGIGVPPGLPPALLIGQDRRFHYAITTGVWRDLPGAAPVGDGFVLRLPPGRPVVESEVLGWLPYVVEDWLDARTTP